MVTNKTKISDIIYSNYHILPIISRFGIFPGFGEDTVENICNEKKINIDLFLIITNVFLFEDYIPKNELKRITIEELINYLKLSHSYFLENKLPSIENKINKLIEICGNDSKKIILIKNFYTEFKNEFIEHINYEDSKIYPYSLKVDRGDFEIEQNFQIEDYLKNHSDIEDKIFDLKNLFVKHLKIKTEKIILLDLISEIFDFEKEMNDHQKLEEKILIPMVKQLENKRLK